MDLDSFRNFLKSNQDKKICNSIALKPGNFGKKLHTYLYDIYNINSNYIPLSIKVNEIDKYFQLLKENTNIYGCGISMPFKEKSIKYIDSVDSISGQIGNINTIVKRKNELTGHNTDYFAIEFLLNKINFNTVTIFGSGAIANTFKHTIKNLRKYKKVYYVARNQNKLNSFLDVQNLEIVEFEKLNQLKTDLFINASAVGFKNLNKSIHEDILNNFKIVFDIVSDPIDTYIILKAKNINKAIIRGYDVAILQSIKQFQLYNDISLETLNIKELSNKIFNQSFNYSYINL